jgi:type IV fimbrial biogenesis protein FimT
MTVLATRRRATGFTLIELMITITIVGVVAALAVPGLRTLILTQYVRSGATELQSALYFARSEAIKRAADIRVIPVSNDWRQGWSVQLADNTVLRGQNALSDQLAAVAGSTITYRNDGRLSGNTAFNVVFKTSNAAIVARCVVVDLSGRPSVVYDTNGNPSDGCN